MFLSTMMRSHVVVGCGVLVSLLMMVWYIGHQSTVVYLDRIQSRLLAIRGETAPPQHREAQQSGPWCLVEGLQTIEQYRAYLHHNEISCENMTRFGGKSPAPQDGRKYVCLDKRYNIKPNNCFVFSFGVNNEWSFENDIAKYGCKVYAYDPTMGKEDHQHSPNVQFFATGIANFKGTKTIGMGKNWEKRKVDRFENLVKNVGLAGREIDFIKLDVELSEIDFLQDMILNSPHVLRKVKQIAMEVHDDYFKGDLSQTSRQQVFWPWFMLLRCHGFKLIQSRNAGRWREVVWARDIDW